MGKHKLVSRCCIHCNPETAVLVPQKVHKFQITSDFAIVSINNHALWERLPSFYLTASKLHRHPVCMQQKWNGVGRTKQDGVSTTRRADLHLECYQYNKAFCIKRKLCFKMRHATRFCTQTRGSLLKQTDYMQRREWKGNAFFYFNFHTLYLQQFSRLNPKQICLEITQLESASK